MVNDKEMNKPLYSMIDVEALSIALAEEDWKKITESVVTDDLYELVASPVQGEDKTVEMVRQVKGHWVTLLFDLKESYIKFIMTYCKDENETT